MLYPTPIEVSLELAGGPSRFKATLTEPPIPGDVSSQQRPKAHCPPMSATRATATSPPTLVYVNYGMPADYEALARMGVA